MASHRKGVALPSFPIPDGDNPSGIGDAVKLHSYDEKVSFDERRDNRFEGGALLGIGLQYQVLPYLQFFAEGRYYYSLTDMQKDYMIDQVPRYNNTLGIQAGILFTASFASKNHR